MIQLVVFVDTEPIYTKFKYCKFCYPQENKNDP